MKMISKSFYYLKFNFLLQLKPNRRRAYSIYHLIKFLDMFYKF